MSEKTFAQVKKYYGETLSHKDDLQTNACCSAEVMPLHISRLMANIHDEILNKFYGCGSPIPPALDDCTVLDLGCGSGRDVYLLSQLVGEKGSVIGVDMTEEQLAIARKHVDSQMKDFGYAQPNIDFKSGYIEDLAALGLKDNSVDVVVSNCVINLSPDKHRVFSEIFRVLKPGGELYFSDVFTGRRMPNDLVSDPVLYGECLSGALYIEDFRRLLRSVGCLDYRVMTSRKLSLDNAEIEVKAGMIDFCSMTIRAFKLDCLEDICEDFGQAATYKGTLPGSPHQFVLDDHHLFITDKPMLVCGNTAAILQDTRYSKYFTVTGDRTTHFGAFDCTPVRGKFGNKDSFTGSCC